MATTQFQATAARKAFPCWDEPNRKATFEITINTAPHLSALSNMNLVKESVIGGEKGQLKQHIFAPTPIMSTYVSPTLTKVNCLLCR